MFKRNEEKTKELLKGLAGDNVSIENIDMYLQQQGVVVDVHVGRLRTKTTLNPKALGIEVDKNEDLNNFFKDYIKKGKVCFIPEKYESKLQSIETSLRNQRKLMSIGLDGKYMPIEVYKNFKSYFLSKKKEYNEVMEEILLSWDLLMESFKMQLQSSLTLMSRSKDGSYDESLFETIVSKIPTKAKYEASYYVDLTVKAFPVLTNLSLFDDTISDEIRESVRKESIDNIYEIMSTILSDLFENVNKVLLYYKDKDCITQKHINILKNLVPRIKSRNVLKNELIDKIVLSIEDILKLQDNDEIAERCEEVQAYIYGFAKEIEVESSLCLSNTAIEEDVLLEMYEGLKSL